MLPNYGITIFLILFIEGEKNFNLSIRTNFTLKFSYVFTILLGFCANSLKEDVAFFFKQDGEGSHDRRIGMNSFL